MFGIVMALLLVSCAVFALCRVLPRLLRAALRVLVWLVVLGIPCLQVSGASSASDEHLLLAIWGLCACFLLLQARQEQRVAPSRVRTPVLPTRNRILPWMAKGGHVLQRELSGSFGRLLAVLVSAIGVFALAVLLVVLMALLLRFRLFALVILLFGCLLYVALRISRLRIRFQAR